MITMWVAECPIRRNGSPVLGSFGGSIDTVVVFRVSEWKQLCAEVPALQTTPFRVGTFDG